LDFGTGDYSAIITNVNTKGYEMRDGENETGIRIVRELRFESEELDKRSPPRLQRHD
jgi:hypothetical protein